MNLLVCPEIHAAKAARDIFAVGGNAMDAAIAAAFVQGVTNHLLCGIGGTISLYENGSVTDRLYVAGGFVEVTTERCTVLATEVLPVGEVSRAVGERRLADAEAAYASADKNDVVTLDMVMDRIQSARAMIEAAGAA